MKNTLLFLISCTLLCNISFAQQNSNDVASGNYADSAYSERKAAARKNVIRLYPNPSYGKISVSATVEGSLNFYVFDLEGTLVYQAVLKNKEKKNIENLQKGTYVYDVFQNDQSIEEGKIIIK